MLNNIKDIFIDADIANSFANAPDGWSDFIDWLIDKESKYNSIIVYSNPLYYEYENGNKGCAKEKSILTILDRMIQEGRYTKITNQQIESFKKNFCSKFDFKCNYKDQQHFPLIFLSQRKMGLIKDSKFFSDIKRFPKFGKNCFVATIASIPTDLDYK
jgi:hypothetical protein